jgi:HD-GYP domain-containing protein (c-di-GMP phosphodiesterase class II)
MINPNKKTLYLEILSKTGGRYDPKMLNIFLEILEEWLPKEQSAAGSQNVYVECSVDGYNDAIREIKSQLK